MLDRMRRFAQALRRVVPRSLAVLVLALVGGVTLVLTASSPGGCGAKTDLSGDLRNSPERSRRLTHLASMEAATIGDVDARLTRLLNLAELQIHRDWRDDARQTLALARKTLGDKDLSVALNEHARISGWVSCSELSRAADDPGAAMVACDGAVTALRALEDPALRCEYVMGVGNELSHLKGKRVASALLVEAGPWTREIDDLARRRQAVVAFASALFNLDEFDAGQTLLRNEDDPVWRSDMLLALASTQHERSGYRLSDASAPSAARAASPQVSSEPDAVGFFGRDVSYSNVFQNQKNSRTSGR